MQPSSIAWPALAAAGSLALSACAVGPAYDAPAPQATTTWLAPLPHGGQESQLSDWWSQFHDEALVRLVSWSESDSPSLIEAWAKIEQARADAATARAQALPSVDGSGVSTRSKQQLSATQSATSTTRSGTLDASWEIDLFGKARRNQEAARARVQARVADWHEARVSLAAEVASTYVQYRGCGLVAQVYEREADSAQATARGTDALVAAGWSASSDGNLARASLATARSTATAGRASCAILMKSLVDLTGRDERDIAALLASGPAALPRPDRLHIESVPAQALSQRPDLASLERELAAASADIGVAQADLYPSLSLTGAIGRYRTSGYGSSYSLWSFGPTVSLPIFDGGKLRAAVSAAQASYDSALAAYRQGTRTAIREVEQALVNLDSAGQRAGEAARAADEYRRYVAALESGWRSGTNSLLELEEARRSSLSAEIDQITIEQDQVTDWIALYKALGGGWRADTPAVAPDVRRTDTAQGASR